MNPENKARTYMAVQLGPPLAMSARRGQCRAKENGIGDGECALATAGTSVQVTKDVRQVMTAW